MIKEGDFVRIKDKHAFEIGPMLHYGHCVEIDGDCIKINFDRGYGHDSFVWVEASRFETIGRLLLENI